MARGGKRVEAALTRAGIGLRQLGWARLIFTAVLLAVALIIARFGWQLPLAIEAERALFDWRQVLTAEEIEQDPRIVQIVYDDATLEKTGKRSPLDRAILAKALARIGSYKPKAIGIDILIDQAQPEDDQIVAAFSAMRTPTFLAFADAQTAEEKIKPWQQAFLTEFQKRIARGNVHPASIMIDVDDDNVLRSWPRKRAGGPALLPVAMAGQPNSPYADYQGSIAFRKKSVVERPLFNTLTVDNLADDAMLAIPEVAEVFRQQIEGKYVFIGGHIQDIDVFETPVSKLVDSGQQIESKMWGVESFAHMLAQLLDGPPRPPLPDIQKWLAALVVILAAAATAASNARPIVAGLLIVGQFVLIAAVPFLLQWQGFDTQGLPAFGWGIGWVLAFTAMGSAARAVGSEQRKFAQNALGKYLPRDIAAEILRDPDSLALHGEKREIFVVFTDLEGFTKLSHAIEPEMVATLLNRYLDMLSEVVLRHGGTIDKFVGDAVVAFWGAPISRPDDGERAAKAAWAMFEAGEEFRKTVPDGVPAIGRTRVGLHHGEAVVGNFGGEGRIQYTALGDGMNTAARLESANKQLKTAVLVSREAAELSGLDWFRPMGKIVLRGRATPVEILEPVPQMADTERKSLIETLLAAISGDVPAITKLREMSANSPKDAALANLVYRLDHQDEGGYYVLD